MPDRLLDLIPTLYMAVDTVSRELTGFIPAVTVNSKAESAAVGQKIRVPVTPKIDELVDIVAADEPPSDGDQTIGTVEMQITKSRYAPIRWAGEEQKAVGNTGTFNPLLAQQFAQAMRALVKEVEADIAATYIAASRAYGTPGTTPFASGIGDMAQVRKLLADNGCPMTDLHLVCDGLAAINLRNAANLIHADQAGTDETLRKGSLLDLMGFAVHESAFVAHHAPGTVTGSMAVNKSGGYAKGATSIAWDGATAASLKAGDILSFGTASDKYLVSEASTSSPLTIAQPGLVKLVANDAAVSLADAYTANMAFDRGAIQLLARAPAMPAFAGQTMDKAAAVEFVTDPVTGLTFQVCLYRQYRRVKYEVGLAWGVALVKPEHCVLLLG